LDGWGLLTYRRMLQSWWWLNYYVVGMVDFLARFINDDREGFGFGAFDFGRDQAGGNLIEIRWVFTRPLGKRFMPADVLVSQ